ncbi:PREDICTED: protein teashirt [Rhagoletis zephyria]|uniref:protein teashirt n=1 Tax=Rhagoletis zephyria TaxID=28612 RepID=UPI0008119902|nr:PREDICTED: protein teashirt [Rhagoletis zephyria]
MLHEALMLEIYRQALNAGALPTARPRSTESANSSERCPSHDSNSSENGRESRENANAAANAAAAAAASAGMLPLPPSMTATFPAAPQNLPAQPSSMEAYLQMVAAAAQQYGFPLGPAAPGHRFQLPMPTDAPAPFKLPPQASPNASNNNSEALDFRTNLFARAASAEPAPSEEEEDDDEANDANNPLDLSVGTRKRSADGDREPDSTIGQIQVKKIFKTDSPPLAAPPTVQAAPLLPGVNPYLAAVAAANIFRTGQFPDWNGKNDLVVDPLEKMSDIVKGPRKEKSSRSSAGNTPTAPPTAGPPPNSGASAGTQNSATTLTASTEGMSKARHNIWQSHWQNKGVASSVFRCVWCKQSFSTLEALTTHMKDSKHCGVNVPPFGNLPNTDRHHQPPPPQAQGPQHSHSHRKQPNSGGGSQSNSSSGPSAAAKNAFQYRGDPPTPLPRKLVRGQNVWLGKGVEQAMQILKCMRCGESFRSLGEMTKHMQETQHYTNILSQEQTISMKSSGGGDAKDGHNSLSSEESRTLSAVLTCKVCDKAFNSLGDLSNHMAKNNHYAEPLMQSMAGGAGSRKRPAPKKREKSLPVRKLLEMKGAQNEAESMEAKMQRNYENAKRMPLEGTGIGPGNDKSDAALFAERMRQYITGVKADDEAAKAALGVGSLLNKTKSPDLEPKNGATKSTAGSSSVLSAIEQMFTTSFDTPPRHASLPATSPSNSSTKNTSPVASSILKRLGIDETVDYNKPLIDTSDPYYQHYRYTSSERSGSECSAETHVEARKMDVNTPEKLQPTEVMSMEQKSAEMRRELEALKQKSEQADALMEQAPQIKMEIKSEVEEEERGDESPQNGRDGNEKSQHVANGAEFSISNNNNNNNKERSVTPPKSAGPVSPVLHKALTPRSPTDSHRSATPKSPASSIKSYDGEKKYPSDSLNALSSMFDSLGSSSNTTTPSSRAQAPIMPSSLSNKIDSPENLTTSNSLAALRQFCIKKEKTA